MDHEMRVVCAWCGKHLRGSETAERVSHGICKECREREETTYRALKAATAAKTVEVVPVADWQGVPVTWEQWVDLGGEG